MHTMETSRMIKKKCHFLNCTFGNYHSFNSIYGIPTMCKNTGNNKKKSVFPNFIIKCFLGLEIEFYGKGFIGYILGEEREDKLTQSYLPLTTVLKLIFILTFSVLLNNKRGKIKD